jgi:ParB-like chromosome segregation protein Spo0J
VNDGCKEKSRAEEKEIRRRRSADRAEGRSPQWHVDQLKPYARNTRTHSANQVAALARSITRFGFTNPILAGEDGTIVAGHGRLMAAMSIGMKTVPVIVVSDWTDEERRAYVIADNKLALDAGWDEELLKLELGELAEAGIDLELTGFKEEELNNLFGAVADDVNDPDAAAPQLEGLTYSVIVRCDSEAQQGELLEQFEGASSEAES